MGNGIAAIIFGRSEAEQAALLGLISQEDEIFRLQPGEDGSLMAHVRADLPRFQLLNARSKLTNAVLDRKSDRNLYATVTIGVLVFVKSGLTWAEIIHFFASI